MVHASSSCSLHPPLIFFITCSFTELLNTFHRAALPGQDSGGRHSATFCVCGLLRCRRACAYANMGAGSLHGFLGNGLYVVATAYGVAISCGDVDIARQGGAAALYLPPLPISRRCRAGRRLLFFFA